MQWYFYLIIVVCCLFSMFFSSADMVYSSVDVMRLEKEANKNNKKAMKALNIVNDYELPISAILLGNNIVNVFASSLITIIGLTLSPSNPELGTIIATICFTLFVIIFCEFLPKAFSKRFSYALSLFYAYPITAIKYLLFPLIYPVAFIFKSFVKLFAKKAKEEETISVDELDEMVNTIENEGILEEKQADLLREAIDLSDIEAYEIMTPRVDVYAIDINDDLNSLLQDEEMFKYSRIPVYEQSIDDIIGILPIKTLAKKLLAKEKNIDLLSLCYKPLVVPRNHQILDLLSEFKANKVHIAIVKDEYGGTEGIVTMEDILEEIVGDIFDEDDEIIEQYIEEGNGVYLVDGTMNIDDFFELIEYGEEVDTSYSTVGGFCQDILDRFAKKGDEFDFSHFHFIVLEADEFTIEKLKVIDLNYEQL